MRRLHFVYFETMSSSLSSVDREMNIRNQLSPHVSDTRVLEKVA